MAEVDPYARDRLGARLAANSAIQIAGSGLASAISFFTFVAITRGLGPEAFGDFTAAMVFLFIPVVLADVGLSAAVLREISARPERTPEVMRISVSLRSVISALAVLIGLAVGLLLPFNEQTKTAILIGAAGAFLTLMTSALQPVLQAQLKLHWVVVANVSGRLVTLAATLAVLAAGLGFNSVVLASVVGVAVTFLLHLAIVARLVPLAPSLDLSGWRALLRGSLVVGAAIGLSQIYFRIDTVLLAMLRSPEEVGLYGAAYKFVELSEIVVAAVAMSMFPPLARFLSTGDERARGLVQSAFDVLLAASAALALFMIAFAEQIIVLTAGSEFEDGAIALQLLAPYAVLGYANGILWRVLIAVDRDLALLAIAVSVLVLNVALNLLLIPEYGYKAAAVISVASEAFVFVLIGAVARGHGLLPSFGFAPAVLLAVAAAGTVILFLPGPTLVVAVVAAAVYAAVVVAMPGTVRTFVHGELMPATARLVSRSGR
jgi:O-antigen/teichoic acid export membrane protein